MFRGFMPALTLFVFGIGISIGWAWMNGFIPLSISPANSGTLSIEVTQREALPPPNEPAFSGRRRVATADLAQNVQDLAEQQYEPEVDERQTIATLEQNRARPVTPVPTAQQSEPASDTEGWAEETQPQPGRVRLRDRKTARVEAEPAIEQMANNRSRQVKAIAHQEPADSANDGVESKREQPDSITSARELLMAAKEKFAAGEILAAHRDLSKLYWNHPEMRPQLQDTIDATAKEIFFQPKPNFVDPYVIQEGDRLEVIARKYQLTWEYLAKLNKTEPRRIQIGQKLKVAKGPFGAVVDLKDFALTIHLQGYYVKRYLVGIGKDGSSPIGKFPVLNKVENPAYTAPNGKVIPGDDPSNPLGERWLDLGESYGIHGTIEPNSIGKAESRGCIRLRDKDIIEVYDFLVKNSEVVIRK